MCEDALSGFESRVGTPAWMAPEVLRGEVYGVGADVYSFGVVGWEVLAREEPFGGANPFAIAFQVGMEGRRCVRQPTQRTWAPAGPALYTFIALISVVPLLSIIVVLDGCD